MTNIIPLHDYVVIKPIKEELTISGIVLPDSIGKEKSEKGTVMFVGNGKVGDSGYLKEMSVKVSDKIMFNKYSASEFNVEGEEYLILKESDIIAIIN